MQRWGRIKTIQGSGVAVGQKEGQNKQKSCYPDGIEGLMFPIAVAWATSTAASSTSNSMAQTDEQRCGFSLMFLAPAGNVSKVFLSTDGCIFKGLFG